MHSDYLFTSESVSEGHPDKVSDQISDAIVDLFLSRDPEARVACETLTTTERVVLAGEVRGTGMIDKEGNWEPGALEEIQFHSLASSRNSGCIHAGASRKSFNNCCRSFAGSVRFKCAIRSGVMCAWPRCRNACISNPLNFPAAAMLRGVVRRNWISCRPIFTVRDGPSVRKTAFAGTCSDNPSRFVA